MFVDIKNFFCLLLFLCLTAGLAASADGQEKKPPKTPPLPTKERHPLPGPEPPGVFDNDGVTTERAMMVDPGVTIKLCVAQGDLKVNGWRRNEVRVFVRDGRRFGMKGLETSAESGKTNWLYIGRTPSRAGPAAECLAGENIEIDAPIGASLDLSGREVRTTVDSLKKVKITVVAGAITLRNITGGIYATTNQGDVTVENSAGSIELGGTTGNIVIAEVKPGQIGDLLKAKTNSGAITMQRVEHRQIQANSITGALFFDGKFLLG